MVHQYQLNGFNIVLDTCSGSVHPVDPVAYDAISLYETHSQQLFDEGYHLTYLDAFAGNEALLASYEEKFHAVAALRRDIQRLTRNKAHQVPTQRRIPNSCKN